MQNHKSMLMVLIITMVGAAAASWQMGVDVMSILMMIGLIMVIGVVVYEVGQRRQAQINFMQKLGSLDEALKDLRQDLYQVREETELVASSLLKSKKMGRIQEKDYDALFEQIQGLQERISKLTFNQAIAGGIKTELSNQGRMRDVPAATIPVIRTDMNDSEVLQAVNSALNNSRVDLYLQPIVRLPHRKREHYECLARVRNADGSILLPSSFMKVVHDNNLLAALDNMMLLQFVQMMKRGGLKYPGLFFFNLSQDTLEDEHYFGDFMEFLEKHEELAKKIAFEIPQQFFDTASDQDWALIARLKKMGAHLALDRVTSFRLDIGKMASRGITFLKLDVDKIMPFLKVQPPTFDLDDLKLQMRRQNMQLVVEKIETETVLKELLDYSVDFGQGYLFGGPRLGVEEAEAA